MTRIQNGGSFTFHHQYVTPDRAGAFSPLVFLMAAQESGSDTASFTITVPVEDVTFTLAAIEDATKDTASFSMAIGGLSFTLAATESGSDTASLSMSVASGSGTAFTWDAANTSDDITIVGAAADVTTDAADANKATRSTQAVNGKSYVEYVLRGVITPDEFAVGLSNENNVGSGTLKGSEGLVYLASGEVWTAFGNIATLPAYTASNVIAQATDWTAKKVWFKALSATYWNNDPTANPATGTGGLSFSGLVTANNTVFLATSLRSIGDGVTIRSSGVAGSIPSGFTAGNP